MFFEGKIIGKWKQPTSEWITKYCYPCNVPKIQQFPFSITLECGNCNKETWLQITETQDKGIELIQCSFCKEYNSI
jgi:hypothetical protein